MAIVYLGLGSNLGDRRQYIQRALEELKANQVSVLVLSSIIETKPVGGPQQGNFLNAVVKVKTDLSAEGLFELVKNIELRLGRIKKEINGPRVIDIDILLYDDIKLISRKLLIPHPRMLEREFVMNPLKEIAPQLCSALKQ